MQSADDVDFGRAALVGLLGGVEDLVEGHLVAAVDDLVALRVRAVERAEFAAQHTEVAVVDVSIDVVERLAAVEALADEVGEPAEREDVARAVQGDAVVVREAFATGDFVRDRTERGVEGLEDVDLHGGVCQSL